MSESSIDSETICKQNGRDQDDNDKSTSKIRRSLRALLSCFKSRKPRAVTSHEETIEYDNDEYDYIVEKLVVKRVPLSLVTLPAELDDRYQTPSTISASTSLSTDTDDTSLMHVTRCTSRTMIDRTAYDFAASKALCFDNENQTTIRWVLSNREKNSISHSRNYRARIRPIILSVLHLRVLLFSIIRT